MAGGLFLDSNQARQASFFSADFGTSTLDFTGATIDGLDVADLGSGLATDGQVATADGAGGVAWESLPIPGSQDLQTTYDAGDGTIDLDASGPFVINLDSGSAGNDFTVNSSVGGADNFALTSAGANAMSLAANTTTTALSSSSTTDIDAAGAVSVNSSGAAINVGDDAVAQPVNIGTGAAARVITVGNAASASMALDAGVGGLTAQADTTMDLDAGGALSINSTGGAINVGNDANAQAVNIATGAAARVITIGNAASASMALDAGVGGLTAQADTTMDLDSGGALSVNSSGGVINVGNDAVNQNINVGTSGNRTITVGATGGTSSLDLKSGSGGINANDGTAQIDLTAGALTETSLASADITPSGALTLRGGGISQFGDDTGYANFDGSGAMSTSGVTTMDLDASGSVSINSTGGSLNLGNDANAQAINIGTGAAQRKVTVGNASGNTEVEVNTGTVGFDVNAGGPLTLDGAGNSNFITDSGDLTIENTTSGNMTIDSAGTLGIGEANATEVNIAQAGVETTVGGNLEVDEGLGVDGDVRIGAAGASAVTMNATTGDTLITGNLTVQGDITGIVSPDMIVADNYLQQAVGYTAEAGRTGGLVINYLPTGTDDTVSGNFVAGVASTSNPTVGTTGAAVFSDGDVIQVSGSTNNLNDGFYEVKSHAANVLTIYGIGTDATTEEWSRNQFIAQTPGAGTITKVGVSVMRASSTGGWETGYGDTVPLSYSPVATGTLPITTTENAAIVADDAGGIKENVDAIIDGSTLTLENGGGNGQAIIGDNEGDNTNITNGSVVAQTGVSAPYMASDEIANYSAAATMEITASYDDANSHSLDISSANAGAGNANVTVLAKTNVDVDAATTSINATTTLNVGTDASALDLNMGNGTGNTSVSVDCGTGGATFGTNATAHSTEMGSSTGASSSNVHSGTGGLTLGADANAHEVTIGSATGVSGITANMGTGGIDLGTNAVAGTVTIGNTTGASSTVINTGTGPFDVNSGGNITMDSAGSTTITNGTGDLTLENNSVTGDIALTLGDAAGVTSVSIKDSTTAEVASIDSDGNAKFESVEISGEVKVTNRGPMTLVTAGVGGSVAKETCYFTGNFVATKAPDQSDENNSVTGVYLTTELAGQPVWMYLSGSMPEVKWNSATAPTVGTPAAADGLGGVVPYDEFAIAGGKLQILGMVASIAGWASSGDPVTIIFNPQPIGIKI